MAILGGNALVTCNSFDGIITQIQWFLDGEVVENLPPSQVNTVFNTELRIGLLELNNLTHGFNISIIQCRATFDSGMTATSSAVLVLIQGLLVLCWCRLVML